MSKREIIHEIIDRLLDLEEQTGRCAFFNYSGHVESVQFHVSINKEKYSDYIRRSFWVNLESNYIPFNKSLKEALAEIELIKVTPDPEPEDEEVMVRVKKSKALDLGLLTKETI